MYFSKKAECLALVRHVSANVEATGSNDTGLLLQALATYFHLGIHAHAFVRINQSLLWAQVNYVLMLNHMRPVCHEYVDLVTAFLDVGNFCSYFRRHISVHNRLRFET